MSKSPHDQLTSLNDTDVLAEQVLRSLLRQASVARKLQLMVQLNASGRTLALSDLRRRYPMADDVFIKRKLAERMLGKELARKCFTKLQESV